MLFIPDTEIQQGGNTKGKTTKKGRESRNATKSKKSHKTQLFEVQWRLRRVFYTSGSIQIMREHAMGLRCVVCYSVEGRQLHYPKNIKSCFFIFGPVMKVWLQRPFLPTATLLVSWKKARTDATIFEHSNFTFFIATV